MGYTYCMSDIHGEIDRYFAMLQEIQFSDDDTLYVIGDVIDRHPGGVDILRDIMKRENVHLLMGNHEAMCLATLGPDNQTGARAMWAQNGGNSTRRELLYHTTSEERKAILEFLAQCPYFAEVNVNGHDFYLTHGFPCERKEDVVWARPELSTPNPIKGKTLIVGHTPVLFITHPERKARMQYIKGLENAGDHLKILHADGFLDIDCACGNDTDIRRLACLRLDDMQEFYV